jgi:predicted nuclease of restriction endonuclease-like RecB superfamily
MLTGKLVRVKQARNRVVPLYLDVHKADWVEVAERLLEVYRGREGTSRGEFEADLKDLFGDDPSQLIHQGLAKLVEDRCDFETAAEIPPEQLRAAVFKKASVARADLTRPWDRAAIVAEAAADLGLPVERVEATLFADLYSEQRLVKFDDISPERLLERYNVGLAQAVLLRSTKVAITIRREPPARYRQLLRAVKFHRLICDVEKVGPDSYRLHLDGPLSLFSSTTKYGIQLAHFLPTVLLCRDFEIQADVLWGAKRTPKTFTLTPADKLVSHLADRGTWTPPELAMFVELFRKRIEDWQLIEETEVYPLGPGFWVPDFQLVHVGTGEVIRLEVLGFWRKASAEKHLAFLREHVHERFLLAVSDGLHIEDGELEGLPAGIVRFKNLPLPDEIARLATEMIS